MGDPASPDAALLSQLSRDAEAAAAAGQHARSIAMREHAVRLFPDCAAAHVQLSYALSLGGNFRRAEAAALAASRMPRLDARVLVELLPRLRTFNAGPRLLDVLARAGAPSQLPIGLLLAAGAQLSYLNLPERALPYLDEAVRADPDYPPSRMARTQVRTYLGDFDGARADIERVLTQAPQIAHAHWLAAQLPPSGAWTRVDVLQRELARPGRSAGDIASLASALHRVAEAAGDLPLAWEALERSNAAKRSTLSHDPARVAALFDALVADAGPASERRGDGPAPIFVVGMHRSGTTLLERLLSGHPQVRGLGELYDFTTALRHGADHHCRGVIDETIVERLRGASLRRVGERYREGVAWRIRAGDRAFVDKLPSNFLNVGHICRALPEARILHMRREPMETCFSNLRELFSDANAYSYRQDELAAYYRGYRRLMAHWHDRYPGRILDVDYARLVGDTEATMREVAAFCGLDFQPAMLSTASGGQGVVTASAVQVRGPIRAAEVPKWKAYARWLEPLHEGLRAAG